MKGFLSEGVGAAAAVVPEWGGLDGWRGGGVDVILEAKRNKHPVVVKRIPKNWSEGLSTRILV